MFKKIAVALVTVAIIAAVTLSARMLITDPQQPDLASVHSQPEEQERCCTHWQPDDPDTLVSFHDDPFHQAGCDGRPQPPEDPQAASVTVVRVEYPSDVRAYGCEGAVQVPPATTAAETSV